MRKYYLAIAMIACISFNAAAQKQGPVTAAFPKEMAPNIQAQYKELWEKGKILYGINCAKCHNTVVKRKELIPDFTPEQLKGYEIRVANAQHEENMPDELVTAEELVLISTFLQYKAKSGVAGPGKK